jgi:hypothetical protein
MCGRVRRNSAAYEDRREAWRRVTALMDEGRHRDDRDLEVTLPLFGPLLERRYCVV